MHAPIRVDVGELASGEDDTGPHVGHAFVEPQAASPRNRDDRRPVLHACRLNARRNSSALTSATGVTPIWVCGIPCWVGGRGPARRRSGERWLFAGSIGGLHLSHCLARYPCAVGSVGLVRSAGGVRQNRHDASIVAGVSITGMGLSWRWLRWSEYRKGSGREGLSPPFPPPASSVQAGSRLRCGMPHRDEANTWLAARGGAPALEGDASLDARQRNAEPDPMGGDQVDPWSRRFPKGSGACIESRLSVGTRPKTHHGSARHVTLQRVAAPTG